MVNALLNSFFFNFILFLFSSLSSIYCEVDWIYLNKRECLYMDQIKSSDDIISFEYYEGHSRLIHRIYESWSSEVVVMKYIGDSSKDIPMKCLFAPRFWDKYTSELYHYHIPCYVQNVAKLNEGNYCIEITKGFVGDILNPISYCNNNYTFPVTRSINFPNLNVIGFSNEQNGCVQLGEKVTLLAVVKNKISNSQGYNILGISLSNTEVIGDNIPLQCKIEGKKGISLSDKITCIIPDDISEGDYSILYSDDLAKHYQCPSNIIKPFNSLNFNDHNNKLKIYKRNDNGNIESKLTNITFINHSKINLTFSLNNIQNINSLSFNSILNQDLGIKLMDNNGIIINTKCDLINSNNILSIFYLICTPEDYENNIQYSLLILDDIIIGNDFTQTLCTYGENSVYKKIIIKSAEYDFFIIYKDDNNTPYLDCYMNEYGFYQEDISNIKNLCGNCGKNCLKCENSNICIECIDGFTLTNSKKCELIKDKINFDKFKDLVKYIPHEESCDNSINNKQLFSFKFSYIITKGENYAIESEEYNNIVFGINEEERYGLNCIIDVNPDYIPNENFHGTCKEITCNLFAFVNCSFHEKVLNGIYDIQANSNNDLGNLINKAKDELEDIQIKFIDIKIIGTILDDTIEVIYKGYASSSEKIYVCPNIDSQISDCNEIKDCTKLSYDDTNEETKFECSKEIITNVDHCLNFERIMMKDNCNKYINESFEFKFCPDLSGSSNSTYSSNSSRINFINLFILFFILLLFII